MVRIIEDPSPTVHGILLCRKCDATVDRCLCLVRKPECNRRHMTAACPACVAKHKTLHGEDGTKGIIVGEDGAPIAEQKEEKKVDIDKMAQEAFNQEIKKDFSYEKTTASLIVKLTTPFGEVEFMMPFNFIRSVYKDLKQIKASNSAK